MCFGIASEKTFSHRWRFGGARFESHRTSRLHRAIWATKLWDRPWRGLAVVSLPSCARKTSTSAGAPATAVSLLCSLSLPLSARVGPPSPHSLPSLLLFCCGRAGVRAWCVRGCVLAGVRAACVHVCGRACVCASHSENQ